MRLYRGGVGLATASRPHLSRRPVNRYVLLQGKYSGFGFIKKYSRNLLYNDCAGTSAASFETPSLSSQSPQPVRQRRVPPVCLSLHCEDLPPIDPSKIWALSCEDPHGR